MIVSYKDIDDKDIFISTNMNFPLLIMFDDTLRILTVRITTEIKDNEEKEK